MPADGPTWLATTRNSSPPRRATESAPRIERLQQRAEGGEHGVAAGVAVAVVDVLEAVEVEQQDGVAGPQALQRGHAVAAVADAGQVVAHRLLAQAGGRAGDHLGEHDHHRHDDARGLGGQWPSPRCRSGKTYAAASAGESQTALQRGSESPTHVASASRKTE